MADDLNFNISAQYAEAAAAFTALGNDVDTFKRKLEELDRAGANPKLTAEASDLAAKLIKAQADLDKLNAQKASPKVDLDIAAEEAKLLQVKAKLDELNAKKSTPKVDADIAAAQAKMAIIEQRIRDLKDAKVNVDLDIAAATAKIAALKAELAALGDKHVTIDVDTKDGASKIRELSNAVDSFAGIMSTKMGLVGASILPALSSIGQLSGALGLIPAVATGAGAGLATVVIGTQGMSEALKASEKATKAQEAATKADAAAQRDAATATQAATTAGTGNIAVLKQAVAEGAAHVAQLKAQKAAGQDVTSELKAAQTAQAGNVAALKTAQAAYSGNTSAAGAYSSAQKTANSSAAAATAAHKAAAKAADEQAAAMKNLAPAAQGVVSAIIQLGPAFTDLRMDVQQHLFEGMKQVLLDMANTALPVVKTGLSQMADAINKAMKNVGEFIQQQSSINAWREIFANVATAASNLAGAVKPILQIITDVTKVGSQFLPQLAQHFAEAAQRAADFVSNAEKTGQLHQWIQTGIDAVKQLWESFKNVVAIIKDLAASPGFGPSFLQALELVTKGIRWLIENIPGLTTAVQLFFEAWLIAKVVSGLTGMVTTIGTLATALTGMATAGTAAATAETAVGTAASGLLGPLALLAVAALAAFSPQGQALIQGWKSKLDELLGTMRNADGVITGFGGSAKQMADAAKGTTFDLSNLGEAVKKLKDDIATSMGPIPAIATAAIGGLVPIINTGVANIATAIGKLSPLVQASLVQLAPAMRAPTEAALAGLLPIVESGMQNITNQVNGLTPQVQTALAPLSPAMQQSANAALGGMLTVVNTGVANITAAVQGINTAVAGVPTSHATTFTGDPAAVLEAAQSATGAVNGVPAQFLTTFLGEPGAVVAATATAIAKINSVPPSHSTNLIAVDQASATANYIKALYAQIPANVQTVITTIQRTVQGAEGFILTPMAEGGIAPMAAGGSLTRMGGGSAQVVAPNTWRVIGDNMASDEAYIPINQSARSQAILGETANRMGYALMPMASGGYNRRGNGRDDDDWTWEQLSELLRGGRWGGHGGGSGSGGGTRAIPDPDDKTHLAFGSYVNPKTANVTSGYQTAVGAASITRSQPWHASPWTSAERGSGPPPPVIHIHPGGSGIDQMFMKWLREAIRVQGGLQLAFGS